VKCEHQQLAVNNVDTGDWGKNVAEHFTAQNERRPTFLAEDHENSPQHVTAGHTPLERHPSDAPFPLLRD